jgi:hypothetical protein
MKHERGSGRLGVSNSCEQHPVTAIALPTQLSLSEKFACVKPTNLTLVGLASGESPLTCVALRLLDESTRKLSAGLDLSAAMIYYIQCMDGISFFEIALPKRGPGS